VAGEVTVRERIVGRMNVSFACVVLGCCWKAVVKMSTLRLIMLISKDMRFGHDFMVWKMSRASELEV
jgi:hypothetical protein